MKNIFNSKLFVIWVVLVVSIAVMSFFYENGRTSSDSANYLRLAQSLVDGKGYYLPDVYSESGEKYFAQWPIGYPTIIAVVAKVTSLSVFWAAKLTNIIFVSLALLIMSKAFGEKAWVYGLVLLTASPLNVLSMTWSEAGMIVGLLVLALMLYQFYRDGKLSWLVGLVLVFAGIFLMRYAAVFVITVIGGVGLYCLFKKEVEKGLWLIGAAVISTALAILYLWHNILVTGYILGRESPTNDRSWVELTKSFVKALISELNIMFDFEVGMFWLFLSLFILVVFIWIFFRPVFNREDDSEKLLKKDNRWVFLLIVGASQLLAMVYLYALPGTIDHRYLLPSSFLFLLALVDYWHNRPRTFLGLKRWLLIVVTLTWCINVPGKLFYTIFVKEEVPYNQSTASLVDKYKDISSGSLVAFADKRLWHLRPDINTTYLSSEILYINDRDFRGWSDVMNKFMEISCEVEWSKFYIDVNEKDRSLQYWINRDQSVQDFIEGYEPDKLYDISEKCNEQKEN